MKNTWERVYYPVINILRSMCADSSWQSIIEKKLICFFYFSKHCFTRGTSWLTIKIINVLRREGQFTSTDENYCKQPITCIVEVFSPRKS